MSENPYSKMSLEELNTKVKTLKSVTSIFSGILFVLVFAVVFLGIRKGFSAISIVPVALIPILIINLGTLKKIQDEIKSRNS
ncbi:hypothetical protein EMA8858_02126 [Emticicia aquatica]|uniref:Redox-active disulfide protein 2 n=1 Tax=Emticicia aquatica TaxID=1681835 RepID=A0ABM9AR73_9BACT|nr:hypothetical protein [Emticicia aquatica]CAH0995998.1 hypothetical protein EMA8858_02126 [Emticicia aquatica]